MRQNILEIVRSRLHYFYNLKYELGCPIIATDKPKETEILIVTCQKINESNQKLTKTFNIVLCILSLDKRNEFKYIGFNWPYTFKIQLKFFGQ